MSLIHSKTDALHFKNLLREQGIVEALRFLNSKSAHRFTALYAIDGAILRNICLVDKENDAVRRAESIKVTDSYCLYVRNSGQKFITPESLRDERLQDHPKQATIQSYCGMPLVGDKAMLGTLCHFDFTPLAYTEEEILLLERITPDLVTWLENENGAWTENLPKDVSKKEFVALK